MRSSGYCDSTASCACSSMSARAFHGAPVSRTSSSRPGPVRPVDTTRPVTPRRRWRPQDSESSPRDDEPKGRIVSSPPEKAADRHDESKPSLMLGAWSRLSVAPTRLMTGPAYTDHRYEVPWEPCSHTWDTSSLQTSK